MFFKTSLLYAAKSARWLKSALTHVLLLWSFLGSTLAYGQNVASFTPTISADGSLTCAIKNDGALTCWGWGSILSDETLIEAIFPNLPKTGQFSQVSISITHGCAVKTDNTLVCWGKDDYGQATPPNGQFLQVSVGSDHSCGLKTDNTIVCWGDNQYGQATPPTGTFLQVDAGGIHTCAMKNDNTVVCWGNATFPPAPSDAFSQISSGLWGDCGVKKSDSTLACWGTQDTPPSGTFSAVDVGIFHDCAIRTDGTLACWGTNDYGEATPPSGTFSQVTAGMFHTCGVKTDGSVACWGDDTFAPAITVLMGSGGINIPGQVPTANQPPVANFTVTPPQGEAPLTVTLDASSSNDPDGTISKYEWSVNGKTLDTVTGKSVSVTLETAGDYSITLTVTDDKGASGTKTGALTVSEASNQFCTSGSTIIDNTTTICTNGNCTSSGIKLNCYDGCQWCDPNNNCGNVLYNGVTPIPGGSISCTNGRCSGPGISFNCKNSTSGTNQTPKADFYVSPDGGQAPLTVALDASPSVDSDGSIVSYQWSVNGQTLTGKTVSVTLEKAGDYPITLTVTDDKGATGTKTGALTVSEASNQFCTSGSTIIDNTTTICTNGNCTSSGIKLNCYDGCQWCDPNNNCGNVLYNGVTPIPGGSITCTNGQCSGPGISFNCKNSTYGTNQAPKADFYVSPDGGQAPLTIGLDASPSADSDGSIVSYQWSVNGQTLTGKTVSVTLEKAGDYPITLTVTDDKGATDTKTGTITVSQPVVTNQPPVADYSASPTSGQAPLTVSLDASLSSDPDGSIVSYQWSVNGQTLTGKTVSVTLEKTEDYPVTLMVTDDKGATDTKTGTITVSQPVATNQPPVADYSASPTSGQAPLTVTLDASSSSDSDGSIVNYQWSVNGQTLSGKTVSVTLDKAGDYPIILTVTDDKGATGTKTDKITVSQPVATNQPPVADYSASPTSGQAPLSVTLDASPSSDSDGSIVSYQWSVNGQTLTGKTVSVTLEKAGDYPITLTVTDDKGATGTKAYAITVSQPAVILAPKIRIEPATLTFDNTAGTKRGNRDTNDTAVEIHKVPGNQELFIEDSSRIEENSSEPTITRINYAEVNPYALSQPDTTFGTVYAEQVILNLFPDVSFTVNNTSVNYRAENDYTWIGKIEGMPFGDVILVVKDGRITGNINAQGEVYRIRPSQDGWHAIQKMNPAAFPEDAPSPLSFIPPESLPSDEEQRSQSRSARGTRDSSTPIIDVMVVYTPLAAQTPTNNPTHDKMDITSEIQLAVNETNQVYANSAIKQRLRLVHTEQVNYTEGDYNRDLNRLTSTKDGFLDEVHRLRIAYKADLVSLWLGSSEVCGYGHMMSLPSKDFAVRGFTLVNRNCATAPVYAFAHELGHNMGAHHDKRALFNGADFGCLDGFDPPYPYNCGYVHYTGSQEGSWRTIMAYYTQCDNKTYLCPVIPYFSNPDIMYNGVATGDASANNALTLNNTADIVASFRDSSSLLTEETQKFTIYNDGNADLVVSAIALESKVAWIAAPKNTTTIPPNSSVMVNVMVYYTLAPSGQSTNRLLVSSNDSTNPSLPVNIVVNRQVDATAAAFAPADVYDGDVQSLSVTAQAGEGTYQAILEPITLQASVIGSVFGIMGYTPIVDSTVGQNQTTYDPQTGIVRIPIGSTYLPTGEPVLFEVEMKETSPGIFEVTNFVVIPVQAIE